MKQIPNSWVRLSLNEIGEWRGGGTPAKSNNSFWNGNVPWVSPKDMKVSKIRDAIDHITLEAIDRSSAKMIPAQSVLMVARSGILAHSFPVAINEVVVTLNQDLKALTPYSGIEPRFVAWMLQAFQRDILNNCSKDGTTVHSIEMPRLLSFELPVAPTEEQGRIVSKIEELFSELDKGIESLKTAREQLKVYRQAVLKHAFEGKLTARWREENKDKLETADQLLARIQKEREACYQKQLKKWRSAVKAWEANEKQGKKPPKPRAIKILPEFSSEDLGALPSLPDGWAWIKIDKICDYEQNAIKAGPFGSALKKEFYTSDGYKIYGQEQVISGNPFYGNYFVSRGKYLELKSCKVKPFDILISLVGTVGKVLILPAGIDEGIINPRLIKVSPNVNAYNPKFFKYYFESSFVRGLYKTRTHGAIMDVMNLSLLQSLPFPLCSPKEQEMMVAEIEAIDTEIENLEKSVEEQLLLTNSLHQSILKKAFSGQLVAQDPNDEPAAVLLKHIKAEKTAQASARKLVGKRKSHRKEAI